MSNRNAEAGNSDAERNLLVFFAPAKALSTWNPLLGVMLKGNADAQEGLGTIASEWQGFVSHRLQEGMMLTQRLAHCRTPEQILSAYADFWHKAGEDHGNQLATMTRLVTGVARNMVAPTRRVVEESGASNYTTSEMAA
jgi:hypothetical protein